MRLSRHWREAHFYAKIRRLQSPNRVRRAAKAGEKTSFNDYFSLLVEDHYGEVTPLRILTHWAHPDGVTAKPNRLPERRQGAVRCFVYFDLHAATYKAGGADTYAQ
jgi:hypothetical protein